MLSSSIVVFREVFEIVLIVGIVLAATRAMPNRMTAIFIGFGAGLFGSALVALFTQQISSYAEGLGQEYFNAGILLTAAAFIGWTVLWMKKHARHMKKHFEDVGHAVTEGKAPMLSLSAIIALALLREGSEIVLFTYGMLASGQSPMIILSGSMLGLAGGLIVGLLLYFGLIKLSVRIFFQVTSALLILLVAGMVSQAFGFLIAAGAFETLSYVVWDSSMILSEHSIIGQSLGTMIGYTARPTAIQIIAYLLTLTGLFLSMKIIDKNISLSRLQNGATAALLLSMIIAFPSKAYATKSVTSPYVEKGELELKWKGGVTHDDDDDGDDGAWQQKAVVEYGMTERLQIEIEGEIENEGDDDNTDFTALALEGKYLLTPPGEYWVDVGVKGEYEFNMTNGADKVEGKLLLSKDMGKFTHRANFILEREVGKDSDDETEAGIAWSTRYRYSRALEPGFEVYGDFGSISEDDDFDDLDNRAGPVFYGKLGEGFGYDIGYLFGLSDSAPDGTFKTILQYEWHF